MCEHDNDAVLIGDLYKKAKEGLGDLHMRRAGRISPDDGALMPKPRKDSRDSGASGKPLLLRDQDMRSSGPGYAHSPIGCPLNAEGVQRIIDAVGHKVPGRPAV